MPAALRLTRRGSATVTAAVLLALTVLTCALPLLLIVRLTLARRRATASACRAVPGAHAALLAAILPSAPRPPPPPPRAAAAAAALLLEPPPPNSVTLAARGRARAASAHLLALLAGCGGGAVAAPALAALPVAAADAIEFGVLARYPIDGVLQYVFGVLGARSKSAVELDGARAGGAFRGAAALALYDGWDALVVHPLWSGYNRAQQYYEGGGGGGAFEWRRKRFPEARVRLAEEHVGATTVDGVLRRNAVGGEVDVLFALLDGAEWSVWERVSAIEPRVVVVFYQDYWGAEARVVRELNESSGAPGVPGGETDGVDTGRRRLYVGASLGALTELGRRRGYRLAWCLRAAPIAVFVGEAEDPSARRLPLVSNDACLGRRRQGKAWKRDMEAQWHAAQQFAWTPVG